MPALTHLRLVALALFLQLFNSYYGYTQAPGSLQVSVENLLETLNEAQRKQVQFEFEDPERFHWNFVPTARKGLPLRDMTATQQSLFHKILQAALSETGYQKAAGIIKLENILKVIEHQAPGSDYRDEGKYYLSVFGAPSLQGPWAWRIEGHHLALNFLHRGNEVAMLPTFMGSNPGIVPIEPEKGKQLLKEESTKAFALLASFSASQRERVVFSERALPEIITGNERNVKEVPAIGLTYGEMTPVQQRLFRELLSVYIMNYSEALADALIKSATEQGWDKLRFSWAGGQLWGEGHYYRIHGPDLWIEYDNTQNKGNHVHTVVRSISNDFGDDLLRKHYAEDHHRK